MLFGKLIQKFLLLCLLISSAFASDEVKLLNGGREALKERLDLIEKAESKIYLSYFILEKDEVSLHVLEKLRLAAVRGVDVRILVDHMYNEVPKYMATYLVKSGIKFKVFNRGNLLQISRRMHDKIFLVDSSVAILGGRNIEDTYYDQSPVGAKKNYYDRDILVQSSVAQEIENYYLDLWDKKHLKDVKIAKKIKTKKQQLHYAEAIKSLNEAGEKNILEGQEFKILDEIHEVQDGNIQFLHDLPQLVKDSTVGTSKELYSLIENAQESVHIDSPYFILTKELEIVLRKAIQRGVKIRVLTNSLMATDGLLPQAAYLKERKKIAKLGVELYEFNGEYSFHAKSVVIDEKIAVVGSYNFDPRSQNLNTETAIVVRNEAVALSLLESMNESMEVSYRIDENGEPVVIKGELPKVKFGKKLTVGLIRILLVPFIKGQLIVGEVE